MQRWWNKELAFLQFTKSPWWRFAVWGIAFVIIAYCVSDYFVRRYDPNRILPVAPELSNSSYIPSTSPQQQEYNTESGSVAKVKETAAEKPNWDWEGDSNIANAVEQTGDSQVDTSLTLNASLMTSNLN